MANRYALFDMKALMQDTNKRSDKQLQIQNIK